MRRMDVTICGRNIGTASGWDWDQAGNWSLNFYDYEPRDGVNIQKTGRLFVDFDTGTVAGYADDGEEEFNDDIVRHIAQLAKGEQ